MATFNMLKAIYKIDFIYMYHTHTHTYTKQRMDVGNDNKRQNIQYLERNIKLH